MRGLFLVGFGPPHPWPLAVGELDASASVRNYGAIRTLGSRRRNPNPRIPRDRAAFRDSLSGTRAATEKDEVCSGPSQQQPHRFSTSAAKLGGTAMTQRDNRDRLSFSSFQP